MNFWAIIILIGLVLAFVLLFRILRSVLKTAIYFFFLCMLALFIFGILVYTDAASFKKNIGNSTNVFLLVDNNNLLAGIKLDPVQERSVLYTQETLSDFQKSISENKIDAIKKDSYKVFIFNMSVLSDVESNLTFQDFTLPASAARELLQSEKPFTFVVDYYAKKQNQDNDLFRAALQKKLVETFKTEQQFKDAVFSLFILEFFPEKIPSIIKHIRQGTIVIYPQSALFSALQLSPQGFIDDALHNQIQQNKVKT